MAGELAAEGPKARRKVIAVKRRDERADSCVIREWAKGKYKFGRIRQRGQVGRKY